MLVQNSFPLKRLWPHTYKRLLVLLAFDCAVAVLYSLCDWHWLSLNGLPLAPMGSALAIFLAFRANSAYGRWWEARQLWGSLVNTSRVWARQVLTALDIEPDNPRQRALRDALVLHEIAFVHALRCHLRRQNPFPELEGLLGRDSSQALRAFHNVPNALLLQTGKRLQEARTLGMLDSLRWGALDGSLTMLANIQGACERIKNTPLPRQFSLLPRILVDAFCWLVPLGLLNDLGLMTPLASALVSFTLISVDTASNEIETPFEYMPNDTPMSALSRSIETGLREMLDQPRPLPVVTPVEGIVY